MISEVGHQGIPIGRSGKMKQEYLQCASRAYVMTGLFGKVGFSLYSDHISQHFGMKRSCTKSLMSASQNAMFFPGSTRNRTAAYITGVSEVVIWPKLLLFVDCHLFRGTRSIVTVLVRGRKVSVTSRFFSSLPGRSQCSRARFGHDS